MPSVSQRQQNGQTGRSVSNGVGLDDAGFSGVTPEEEQCRDVYAHFGVAAYFAQCFEKFLSNFLLLHARAAKTDLTVKDIGDLEEFLHKKTLGKLLKDVGAVVTHNSSSEQLVKDALQQRNFLMHQYFWARAEK